MVAVLLRGRRSGAHVVEWVLRANPQESSMIAMIFEYRFDREVPEIFDEYLTESEAVRGAFLHRLQAADCRGDQGLWALRS